MAFDETTIKNFVRKQIPNLDQNELDDEKLEAFIEGARRRLSVDKPDLTSVLVAASAATDAANGSRYYAITGGSVVVTGWVEDFSVVETIVNPQPVIADGDAPAYVHPKDIQIVDDGTTKFLRVGPGVATGKSMVVTFTSLWDIKGIESATVTTVPTKYENAIEMKTTELTCLALAAQAAGRNSSGLPGDILNYRTKSAEYRSLAMDFRKRYNKEIGVTESDKTIAAGVFVDVFDGHLTNDMQYMTHGGRRNG